MASLLNAVVTADLVMLSFPLYVDSLPAPDIEVLEQIANRRGYSTIGGRFAFIANCGFPEAHHNDNALASCAVFTRQAGFEWAGSLALGAGEGLVHGANLNEMDGRSTHLKMALDQAAEALLRGESIPTSTQIILNKPFIPGWLYRILGTFGWIKQANDWGSQHYMLRRPYQRSNANLIPIDNKFTMNQ